MIISILILVAMLAVVASAALAIEHVNNRFRVQKLSNGQIVVIEFHK